MTDPVASVRHGYDRWAAVYESDANPLPALEAPVVRTAIGDVRGQSVLDLGCGTGRHTAWLAEAGASVTAVDFSEGMLAEARRKPGMESVRFLAHDLHDPLPISDDSFDLVVSGSGSGTSAQFGKLLCRGRARSQAGRQSGGVGHAPGHVPSRLAGSIH